MPAKKTITVALLVAGALLAVSLAPAAAQGRRHIVVVGGGFYARPFFLFDPWYPYPYYAYPPYGFYATGYDYSSSLRVLVTPKQTEVYIDGYFAGIADDFDGVFQRLRVPPGAHEIELHLDGFHNSRQTLYLAAGKTYKVRQMMSPLAPGETNDPRPAPSAPPPQRAMPWPAAPAPAAPPPGPRARAEVQPGAGTLSIRVQPAGAHVLIDGDPWQGPSGQDRLNVQVPEGRHRIEVEKEGYERFSTEVQVRRGETVPVNISLSAGR